MLASGAVILNISIQLKNEIKFTDDELLLVEMLLYVTSFSLAILLVF